MRENWRSRLARNLQGFSLGFQVMIMKQGNKSRQLGPHQACKIISMQVSAVKISLSLAITTRKNLERIAMIHTLKLSRHRLNQSKRNRSLRSQWIPTQVQIQTTLIPQILTDQRSDRKKLKRMFKSPNLSHLNLKFKMLPKTSKFHLDSQLPQKLTDLFNRISLYRIRPNPNSSQNSRKV